MEAALNEAAFDGFSAMSLKTAAGRVGYDSDMIAAAFPGGVGDLIALWSSKADDAAHQALTAPDARAGRIRERVALGITARLDYLEPNKEAARRAAGVLALPPYAALGAALTWRSADTIWRALGDQSTDFNFYSKRTILTGVLTSTMARWFSDDDPDYAATREFLDRRIDNVMQIEKIKAKVRVPDPAEIVSGVAKFRYR